MSHLSDYSVELTVSCSPVWAFKKDSLPDSTECTYLKLLFQRKDTGPQEKDSTAGITCLETSQGPVSPGPLSLSTRDG